MSLPHISTLSLSLLCVCVCLYLYLSVVANFNSLSLWYTLRSMEPKTFIHEHLLILEDVHERKGKKSVTCYGCSESINFFDHGSESILDTAFSCAQCKNYFLHKRCAELPLENKDTRHPLHSLMLYERSTSKYRSTYMCSVCRKRSTQFTYYCSLCHFNICMLCFFGENVITHECHEHPLTFLSRSILFNCNACEQTDKDSSYLCYTCKFWIHKNCALSPSTVKLSGHDHSLNLMNHEPWKFRKYEDSCNTCREYIRDGSWVYRCCDQCCKYIVHLKCATSELKPSRGGGSKDTAKKKKGKEHLPDPSLIRLPMADDSVDIITYFVKHVSHEETKRETMINHWSHDHQLILVEKENKNEMKGDKILCDCCVQLISLPFYICSKCNYFLHVSCANLQRTLHLPWHPEHQVQCSLYPKFYSLFNCKGCTSYSNGFFYKCEICKFYLDVKCAFVPNIIAHKAHEPQLVEIDGTRAKCHACNSTSRGMRFRCDACKFYLHYKCALLPSTVKHRWDNHPLNLICFPIINHPDEFYCEYCEEEINPENWIYHCRICDQSFHPGCILDRYSNVKFGGTVEVDDHPHPLTFVQKAKRNSKCCRDGGNLTSKFMESHKRILVYTM
ncbi:unnamed protein product [Ilex paraguariensis]|uniref:Cysteine/Histidine-rich C1 domain family protein n=1 Tax=Ilex paraguariensis TaxID=185542 RepID=A0ABC8USF5_9AQUA